MYATITRAKLKAGQQDAFRRFAQEQQSPTDAGGGVSSEFAVKDKDPNRIIGIIRFKDTKGESSLAVPRWGLPWPLTEQMLL